MGLTCYFRVPSVFFISCAIPAQETDGHRNILFNLSDVRAQLNRLSIFLCVATVTFPPSMFVNGHQFAALLQFVCFGGLLYATFPKATPPTAPPRHTRA
jgi:hypothetical protein